MQIISLKIRVCLLNVSFIYIRKTPNNEDINRLRRYIFGSEAVLGDLNLNRSVEGDKKLLEKLCADGKTNHLDEVTTDKLNQLDYVLLDSKIANYAFSSAYSISSKKWMNTLQHVTVLAPSVRKLVALQLKYQMSKPSCFWP